jgi:hypothetical protein
MADGYQEIAQSSNDAYTLLIAYYNASDIPIIRFM